ncbi:hypothetical protein VTI74DRAFT_10889 [Chaetomium olivicolor]
MGSHAAMRGVGRSGTFKWASENRNGRRAARRLVFWRTRGNQAGVDRLGWVWVVRGCGQMQFSTACKRLQRRGAGAEWATGRPQSVKDGASTFFKAAQAAQHLARTSGKPGRALQAAVGCPRPKETRIGWGLELMGIAASPAHQNGPVPLQATWLTSRVLGVPGDAADAFQGTRVGASPSRT